MNNRLDQPNDDYLWDRSGPPDADVARLESLLSRHRYAGAASIRPAAVLAERSARPMPIPRPARRSPQRTAIAAMIALALVAGWLCPRPQTAWRVEPIDGAPTLASSHLRSAASLHAGQWLQTDSASRARIQIARLGEVRVDPGTRIRILPGPADQRLLDLARGSIHASVTAPPRMFQVNTPAARAIDMGCEYTLRIDDSGAGELRVLLGYVLLEWGGRAVTIPMNGGTCLTRPGHGPGTPFFDDASPRFIDQLRRLDFDSAGDAALNAVLSEARPRDALSLWHLLRSVRPEQRADVYDRLSQLKPPPQRVSRTGVLALDPAMLDQWWDQMRPF